MDGGSLVGQKFKKFVEDIGVGSGSQGDIFIDMGSQEKNDSLPLESYVLLEGLSYLNFSTKTTSLKLVVIKWITSKFVFQDLVLQNCFEFLSSDEQETQESCPTILTTNIVEPTCSRRLT